MSCPPAACCGASRAVEQPERTAAQRTPSRPIRMVASVWPRVLGRCGKDAPAVRERHATTRGVVGSVSRPEAVDRYHVADLQDVLADALAHQKRRRST